MTAFQFGEPLIPRPNFTKIEISEVHKIRATKKFKHIIMFQTLYGQTAAALYAKAAGQNAQARQLYNASADTYYKANDAAAYDDWVRARNHWDYFYNRS